MLLPKKLEKEEIDAKLRNRICKAVADTTFNVFQIRLPRNTLWRFASMLIEEGKENSLEYINELVSIARSDSEASRILYDSGFYAQSTYHLQQSVEKLTKAFGLYSGFLDEGDLYTKRHKKSLKHRILLFLHIREKESAIDHITPKTFVLLLRKKFSKEYIKFLSPKVENEVLQKKFKNIDREVNDFERLIKKRKKLAKISKNEINDFLKVSNLYKNAFANVDRRTLNFKLQSFRIGLTGRMQKIILPKDFTEVKKKLDNIEIAVKKVLDNIGVMTLLYPLTIITYPHFTYTRYPSGELSPKDYTKNLGIVSSIPDILKPLNDVIESFESVIKD
jgi:HEPN domain-containing protein